MKNLLLIIMFLCCASFVFSQKKGASKVQATKQVSTPNIVAATSNINLTSNELYSALNSYAYEPKHTVVNNNANLSISYSPFVVGLDFLRIKSAANDYVIQLKKIGVESKELLEMANMKYRYHKEFLPMDGSFNITFIRPDQNLNPKNVAVIPSNKVSGTIRYKMSN